jgi:hypothetical protein
MACPGTVLDVLEAGTFRTKRDSKHHRRQTTTQSYSTHLIMARKYLLPLLTVLTQDVLAQNMFRFACSQLVVERLDPIVTPGSVPSPHVHQIVGGNSFNATVRVDHILWSVYALTDYGVMKDGPLEN